MFKKGIQLITMRLSYINMRRVIFFFTVSISHISVEKIDHSSSLMCSECFVFKLVKMGFQRIVYFKVMISLIVRLSKF